MRILVLIFLISFTLSSFACGGGDWSEAEMFYNLFSQTNISDKAFYPFLRNDDGIFYGDEYYSENDDKKEYTGNIALWNEVLPNWSKDDIYQALYENDESIWKNKSTETEKSAKEYLNFAVKCNELFSSKQSYNSWDYNDLRNRKNINYFSLSEEAQKLQNRSKNQQIKNRYYYQIIRILHYGKRWEDAISLYENAIENKLEKDELYYYITDQVAGCYYSIANYEKAAYLFTKVLNQSIDRKESAFLSFNFCTNQGAEGKTYFKTDEDKKDLQFIKSLRAFSDEMANLKEFIYLDASDTRVELLFARALSNLERNVWTKHIGMEDDELPNFKDSYNKTKLNSLKAICSKQIGNSKVNNKEYWKIANSYLLFIEGKTDLAKQQLSEVSNFKAQKKALETVYEVFSWNKISEENENYLYQKVKDDLQMTTSYYYDDSKNEISNFTLNKVAHQYYKNGEFAKAFLIHNEITELRNINSLELLNDLISFLEKENKNDFEKLLEKKAQPNALDFVYNQKGILYMFEAKPELAEEAFELNKSFAGNELIPNSIFSNNTLECFECDVTDIMQDKVYEAELFSFIKKEFSVAELNSYILELENLRNNEIQWKAKLANYLLGNYYFNISNTGYFRGALNEESNCCNGRYFSYYAGDEDKNAPNKIRKRQGYNLFQVAQYNNRYHFLADESMKYYKEVIKLSNDKELNARCLYMIAKCELNSFYNNDEDPAFEFDLEYGTLELPSYSESFEILKDEYSDTKFHEMIIQECSYFDLYSSE